LHRNCLLKDVSEGKIKEEDVRNYWMMLKEGEDTGNNKRTH